MGVREYRKNFEAADMDEVFKQFAPGAAFYHPGYAEPTRGEAMFRALRSVRELLGDFRFTDHLVGDEWQALTWYAHADGKDVEAVTLFKVDDHDRILEAHVLMRPVEAVRAWMGAMGEQTGRSAPH